MGLPKHDRAVLMPHLSPPADFASTAQLLSEIKMRLKKEMAAERAREFLNQAPPSVVKSQLQALERQLSRLSPQAERALHQALEAALWEDNPASGRAMQLLVRCNDGVVRGFLRPWNELPALFGSPPPSTPPSTGIGVVTFFMG